MAKTILGSIVLAVVSSCAMDAPSEEPQTSVSGDEVAVRCGAFAFREEFYAEPELITLIGTRSCGCSGFVQITGSLDGFGRLAFKFPCDNR